METEVHVDGVETINHKSGKKLDEKCVVVGTDVRVTELPPACVVAVDKASSLGPITPDPTRETRDLVFDFKSPLALDSSPQNELCINSHQNVYMFTSTSGSPHTPVDDVFDSFAPGPDKLMHAPQCRKFREESQFNVVRRLNFVSPADLFPGGGCESETDVDAMPDDEMLLETMYDTIHEAIVEKQTAGLLVETSPLDLCTDGYKTPDETDVDAMPDDGVLLETVYDSILEAIIEKQSEGLLVETSPLDLCTDGYKTPDSLMRLSGIAETCPGAPVKPNRKSRNIDQSLCRKLEF